MHVISKKPFNDAKRQFPNNAAALDTIYNQLKRSSFASSDEMKKVFKTLDNFKYKDKWYVLDIGGNNLRLLAFIEFKHNRMYVKHIVSHAEYDKLCKRYSKS
ncbi:type II toxin-antitoxin system HigB family toxin [Vibrio mediterranei]|jgi:mRNA interferase HigB